MLKGMYKHLLFAFMVLATNTPSWAQLMTEAGRSFYVLGSYRIYPEEKIIEKKQVIAGTHYGGFHYSPLKHVRYDSTTLVILDNNLYFKEYLKQLDLDSLEVLYPESPFPVLNANTAPSAPIFLDKDKFYSNGAMGLGHNEYEYPRPSEQKMKRVHTYLWQDQQGALYLAPRYKQPSNAPFLQPIGDIEIDIATFSYVAGSFYTDKNGLYWLPLNQMQGEFQNNMQLEQSHGKVIVPQVRGGIIIYGQAVYENNTGSRVFKHPYNADEIEGLYGNYIRLKNGDAYTLWGGKVNLLPERKNLRAITTSQGFFMFERNGELYFKGVDPVKMGEDEENIERQGELYYTDNGFYLHTGIYRHSENRTFIHYPEGHVHIYNQEKGAYEPLEVAHFREVGDALFVYKNALYAYAAPIFSDDPAINYSQFQRIEDTVFYTDGNLLFYLPLTYAGTGRNVPREADLNYNTHMALAREFKPIPAEAIMRGVNFDSLQIVSSSFLIDNKKIYTEIAGGRQEIFGGKLYYIPRDKLGFEVKVFAAKPFNLKHFKQKGT